MMCARLVLPSPGGPTRRTWSSASPRPFAAVERDRELFLDAGLADEFVEPARPQALLDLFLVVAQRRRQELRRVHAALFNASRTRSSGGSSESTSARARSASSSDQPSSTSASRATRYGVSGPAPSDRFLGAELLLELEHDAIGRLLADAGDRLEARRVLAHDRTPQLGGRRAGDDGERDLRPDPADREELDEQLPLAAVGEAVELERVLPDVRVRLDRELVRGLALADGAPAWRGRGTRRRRRRGSAPPACWPRLPSQARDHAQERTHGNGRSH